MSADRGQTLACYTLWIDGNAYCGESATVEAQMPQAGAWHLRRPVMTRNALAIGTGEPYIIEGRRSLASHLDRILSRHRQGTLPFREITIRQIDPSIENLTAETLNLADRIKDFGGA